MVVFTQRLKELIKRKRLSQQELANNINLPIETLKYQLRNNNCPIDVVDRISTYLEVPPQVFFEYNGESADLDQILVRESPEKYGMVLIDESLKVKIQGLEKIIEQKDLLLTEKQKLIEVYERQLNKN